MPPRRPGARPAYAREPAAPATQTGAHTFGCLLNGQPWTPTTGTLSNNYKLIYDPSYGGGSIGISADHYGDALKDYQSISISGSPVTKSGTYSIDGSTLGVYYKSAIPGSCYEYRGTTSKVQGQLVVTKLDLVAGIVSGTFNFKLWQPGCDTVKVTAGRFDYKL